MTNKSGHTTRELQQWIPKVKNGTFARRPCNKNWASWWTSSAPARWWTCCWNAPFNSTPRTFTSIRTKTDIRIRLRVDGLLHAILHVPSAQAAHMSSRIKLMGGMDITEKRLPQDGHISNFVMDTQRDIRVACGPTNYGERLVLRLMPGEQSFHRLDDLGFDESQLPMLKRFLNIPYGMILTVGPVGAGKSTTMYGCLDELNDPSKSICTIEDPVERRMDGINQTQINTQIDFTFARACGCCCGKIPTC